MAISDNAVRHLISAATSRVLGNLLADAVNKSVLTTHVIAGVIVATNVSTTIDFGALAVGDRVVILPAVAGNAQFVTVATARTLPQAAVVGSLYIVIRAAEAASAITY